MHHNTCHDVIILLLRDKIPIYNKTLKSETAKTGVSAKIDDITITILPGRNQIYLKLRVSF